MSNNEARFRLTESTPCMQEPLRTQLGLGDTPLAQALRQGEATLPANIEHVKTPMF